MYRLRSDCCGLKGGHIGRNSKNVIPLSDSITFRSKLISPHILRIKNKKQQQITSQSSMFNFFNFETQLNLDEQYMDIEPNHKVKDVPTTANNSPGSIKSSIEGYPMALQPTLDNSFEEGCQTTHARNIYDASLRLYNQGVVKSTQSLTGFNDENCYAHSAYTHQAEPKSIDEAVKANRLLRYCQKINFIEQLQNESELSNLLVELMVLFNPKIFGEIVYIIHTIWNQNYLNFRDSKKETCTMLPKFNSFFGFEGFEIEKQEFSVNSSETKEIVEKSQQNIEELTQQLFESKKLKYFNFKEIRGQKKNNQVLRQQFEQFLKIISRAVYLSAEGVYEQESEGGEEVSVPSFFEQEEEEISENGIGMNRFVRAYSQLQQADEDCSFPSQVGSKKVKRD